MSKIFIMETIEIKIPVVVSQNNEMNINELKNSLIAYARKFINVTYYREQNNDLSVETEMSYDEALKYIRSLSIKGSKRIPNDINGMRDMVNPKYL